MFARGYCRACYHRVRRNGTVERKNVVRVEICEVEGCVEKTFAKNLCNLHYHRAQHPLRATWKLLRSRHPGAYPPAWDRFDAFLADVGERPSPSHQLRLVDGAAPYSAQNVRWLSPMPKAKGKDRKAYNAAYGRGWNMQTKFGITGEQICRDARTPGWQVCDLP